MAIRAVVAMHTAPPSGREKPGVVEKNRWVKISEKRGQVAEQGLREEGVVNQPSIKEERDGRLSEKKPYLHVADMIYLLDGPAIQGFQTG